MKTTTNANTKTAKSILFKVELKGNGIVNYDSKDQKSIYWDTNLKHRFYSSKNNVNYAKKNFYEDLEGNLSYKIKISSDCLRHDIFKSDALFQSPNIFGSDELFYSYIASPASILRGYLNIDNKPALKRKSAITLTDAEQKDGPVSNMEVFSKSGGKNQNANETDNSFFYKETIGKVEYESSGTIDIPQLQFMSCHEIYDRMGFDPDKFELFSTFLKTRMPNFKSELGYYKMAYSTVETPEYGFVFSNENMVFLIKEFFKRLLNLNITRRGSCAKASVLKYKIIYDVLQDTMDNEEGWFELKTENDLEKLDFIVSNFYTFCDEKKSKEVLELSDLKIRSQKKSVRDKKEKIIADKKARKNSNDKTTSVEKNIKKIKITLKTNK